MSGFRDKVVQHIEKLDAEGRRRRFSELAGELDFFEDVFQALNEGILVTDERGILHYANVSAGRLLGFKYVHGRSPKLAEILPALDWKSLLEPVAGGWSRHAEREVEFTYPEHRLVSLQTMPRGEKDRVVILVRDITGERLRAEHEMENGRADAIKDLAAGVAHEIGNPLNALALNLDMMARELRRAPEGERRDRLLRDVGIAREEVRRIDGINREFLTAMRPVRPDLHPGSPADPLKETLAELKTLIESRQIHVTLDLPSALPPVLIDHAQMKQVFFNLIKNALEAMKDGGRLAIEIASTDECVTLAFRDSGVGITEEELARIFEPYRTTKKTGNGLGLMICRRIVRAHGGEIDASSKPKEGTCFTIRLPRLEKRVRCLTEGRDDL